MQTSELKVGRIYKYKRFDVYINVMYYGPDKDEPGYGFRSASKKTGRYDDGVYQVLSLQSVKELITAA